MLIVKSRTRAPICVQEHSRAPETSPEKPDILDSTAAASEVGVLGMTIGTNNLHNNGGDGTYIITLTTANPIPAGGEIHIDFPTGYSLTHSGCDLGSAFTD